MAIPDSDLSSGSLHLLDSLNRVSFYRALIVRVPHVEIHLAWNRVDSLSYVFSALFEIVTGNFCAYAVYRWCCLSRNGTIRSVGDFDLRSYRAYFADFKNSAT